MVTTTSSEPEPSGLNINGENLHALMPNPTRFLGYHLPQKIKSLLSHQKTIFLPHCLLQIHKKKKKKFEFGEVEGTEKFIHYAQNLRKLQKKKKIEIQTKL